MSQYTYTDPDGDKLSFMPGLSGQAAILTAEDAAESVSLRIPKADAPTVAAEFLKAAGQEGVFVAKAYEEVRTIDGLKIHEEASLRCGSGPEEAWGHPSQNPNWLRNKAANYIAIAEYIENKEQRETEAAKKLQERRDALAQFARLSNEAIYDECTEATKRAIDRIIELEDGK